MSLQDVTNQKREPTKPTELKKNSNPINCDDCQGLAELIFIIESALSEVIDENSKLQSLEIKLIQAYHKNLHKIQALDKEIDKKVN
jgi:hypothetical protein